jgi:hypothetical protein
VTLSNWEALKEQFPEGDTVKILRFGHWGPGWFEIMILDPRHEAEIDDIERALADCTVLDEERMSAIEFEQQKESWDNVYLREFVDKVLEVYPDYSDLPNETCNKAEEEAFQEASWEHHSDGPYLTNLDELVNAVIIPCQHCNGEGIVSPERHVVEGLEMFSTCPNCEGTGVLQPELANA